MPIVFVTPLGSSASGASAAIGQIIDYLERGARRPQPNASIVGYYADTPTAAGVSRGRGVNAEQLSGPVETDAFRAVLEGRHPHTGDVLVSAVGSSGRTDNDRELAVLTGVLNQILDARDASSLLGVDLSYVKRLALATERDPDTKNPLHGIRDENNRWQFTRAELDRFAVSRTEKKVVVAYDVTVSFEKSISLAWARASTRERRTIEAALDAGTNAAYAYLEDHAVAVRRGRGRRRLTGWRLRPVAGSTSASKTTA